jgi:hypothetical protein
MPAVRFTGRQQSQTPHHPNTLSRAQAIVNQLAHQARGVLFHDQTISLVSERQMTHLTWNSAAVRFGSKADIAKCPCHVRFTPESGHQMPIRDLSNLMSALVPKMSALTPKADIHPLFENVRFGPKADITKMFSCLNGRSAD